MLLSQIKYDQQVSFEASTIENWTIAQDLSEVFPIRSNTILYKTKTGLGATYNEITADKNSIIVMPYISIIKNKHKQHQEKNHNTIAVYGEISIEVIKDYLQDKNGNKKLLTTPKGLSKIIRAFNQVLPSVDYKKNYFLLIDECHKLIQDSRYRTDMIESMDIFFEFTHKAMVSATPIPPSDPRFRKQNFKNVRVYPAYTDKRNIQLIQTDSIINSLKKHIETTQSECYCIFFNSVSGIKALIKQLGIKDDYNILCSDESVKKLSVANEYNAYSSVCEPAPTGFYKKFNFFTSSFFNGLDIKLPVQPDLILVTDNNIPHTILDPFTDVLQIMGRFRINHLGATHINQITKLTYPLTEEEAKQRLITSKAIYDDIDALKKAKLDSISDSIFEQALKAIKPYHDLLDKHGNYSHFLGDNYLNDIRVSQYYKSPAHLKTAYLSSDLFTFEEDIDPYTKSEIVKLRNKSVTSSRELIEDIAVTLFELQEHYEGLEMYYSERKILKGLFPLVVEAFDRLGFQFLRDIEFKIQYIKRELIRLDAEEQRNSFPFISMIYQEFQLNKPYDVAEIKTKLQQIAFMLGYKNTLKGSDIKYYYRVKEHTQHLNYHSSRAVILLERKFNDIK